MKNKILYCLWAAWYILCVGLGSFDEPEGILKIAMLVIALCFFVPGGLLLWDAKKRGNRRGVLAIRWISAASLLLTLIFLPAFLIAGTNGRDTANLLYEVLILVSSPMICSQYWFLSMFLWACLLSASFMKTKPENSGK